MVVVVVVLRVFLVLPCGATAGSGGGCASERRSEVGAAENRKQQKQS